jgi:hypothetical protein
MSKAPNPANGADSVCPECGKTGRQVSEATFKLHPIHKMTVNPLIPTP